jgi:DNA-directed RNA polymerase specialized sigma24 family protein
MSQAVTESIADEVLVRRARSGDPAACVEFATRWWPIVSRVAWSMLGSTSQALATTEEVLGVALHSPQPLAAPVRFSLYRLAIWLAIIRRRSSRRAARPHTPLFDALTDLDNQDRAAFVLRDVEQLSLSDAAAILEILPAEVQSQAHRARMQLTRVLGEAASAVVEPPRRCCKALR